MIAELEAMCGSPRLAGESLSLTSSSRHGPFPFDVRLLRAGRRRELGARQPRHLFYEAASALMTRIRKWSRLRAWGVSVAKRRGMKRATVAVADHASLLVPRPIHSISEVPGSRRKGGVAD